MPSPLLALALALAPPSPSPRATSRPGFVTQVGSLMEPCNFIPESMSAMNVLKQMRIQRTHLMVVVDEFGGTSGIITLEDILETMVSVEHVHAHVSEAMCMCTPWDGIPSETRAHCMRM